MTNLPWFVGSLKYLFARLQRFSHYFVGGKYSYRMLKVVESELSFYERNDLLQKACVLYMKYLKVDMPNSFINFSAIVASKDKSELGHLKSFSIYPYPPNDDWLQVTPDISFMQTSEEVQLEERDQMQAAGGQYGSQQRQTPRKGNAEVKFFNFRALNPNGDKKIEQFLTDAVDWYAKQIASIKDENRYMYVLQENSHDGKAAYKRYALSNNKTFDNLFIKDKDGT